MSRVLEGWADPKETTDAWSDASDIQGPVLIRIGKPKRRKPGKLDNKRKSLISPQKTYRRAETSGDYVYSTPEQKNKDHLRAESISKSAMLLKRLKNF